jgi:hypothetical protein
MYCMADMTVILEPVKCRGLWFFPTEVLATGVRSTIRSGAVLAIVLGLVVGGPGMDGGGNRDRVSGGREEGTNRGTRGCRKRGRGSGVEKASRR